MMHWIYKEQSMDSKYLLQLINPPFAEVKVSTFFKS